MKAIVYEESAMNGEICVVTGAPKPEIVLADLTEMKQVCRACDEIRTRFDHVDVLINNAAGMFDTYHESSEGIEDAYAVNHLAVFLLTLSLHPSLKKAPHPRVVIVSSNVHEKAVYIRDYISLVKPKYDWSKMYAQTKLRKLMKSLFKVVQLFFISPEKGARTSIFLASDPSVAMVTGKYFDTCKPHPYNPIADDVPIRKLLWDESMTFLKNAGIDGV